MINNGHNDELGTELTSNTRREVLKSTGLVSSLVLGNQAIGTVTAEDKVEIVTHASARGPEVSKTVSRSWKQHYERVKRVRKSLGARLKGPSGVKLISITRGATEFGGKNGFEIQVEADDNALDVEIPASEEGIPINRIEPRPRESHGCSNQNACYNEAVYEPTPGGVTFGGGTAACEFYADPYETGYPRRVMLTAAHVIQSDTCPFDDFADHPVDQHCEDWGKSYVGDGVLDVACVEPNGHPKTTAGYIKQVGGYSDASVEGYVDEIGLADMVSNEGIVWKTGIMTGTQWGELKDFHLGNYNCVNWGGDGVLALIKSSSGDSGGPVYDVRNGDAYMISVHSSGGASIQELDCEDQQMTEATHGTAAYRIRDEFNGQFVPPL